MGLRDKFLNWNGAFESKALERSQWSAAASQRMAYLIVMLTRVRSAASVQRLTQFCLCSVVSGPW